MTAPNSTTAVMTPSITNLLPRAVDLAIERGELPPHKHLMTQLKIGAPKARLIRDALARPKRTATPAVLAAIARALEARRTCSTCGEVREYTIPRRLGECLDCAEPATTEAAA